MRKLASQIRAPDAWDGCFEGNMPIIAGYPTTMPQHGSDNPLAAAADSCYKQG
ncbi:MAG TPA: hypothetical protein PLZ95_04935 [Bryobacteraceae bacterium]|nr:hypothetical protein [Bryobacteraceae bacterium]